MVVLTQRSDSCSPSGTATQGQTPARHERLPAIHRSYNLPNSNTEPADKSDCHWVQT